MGSVKNQARLLFYNRTFMLSVYNDSAVGMKDLTSHLRRIGTG